MPCQIRINPAAESRAPYSAHCRLPIMKLDAGQATAPVPWPIQSSPIASARKPSVTSSFRMAFTPFADRDAVLSGWKRKERPAVASNGIQSRSGRQGGKPHAPQAFADYCRARAGAERCVHRLAATGGSARLRTRRNGAAGDRDVARLLREALWRTVLSSL